MKPTIVFSHANGFPACTYRVLFEAWRAAGWRVIAVPKFGHDPRRPVTSNWPHLRDELLGFVEAEVPGARPGAAEPARLVYVGHSMGGYLSLLAASRRPLLTRAVVLLDAPVLDGWKAHSVHVLKLSGLFKRGGPGVVSARRRETWPSRAAALEHFAAKRAFALWDRRVLEDYVGGFEPDPSDPAAPEGVRLGFHRDVETRIYQTLPHHIATLLHRHPPGGPVSYIGGTRSAEGRRVGLAGTRAVAHHRIQWIEGSHLFPMERPEATAEAVLRAVRTSAPV